MCETKHHEFEAIVQQIEQIEHLDLSDRAVEYNAICQRLYALFQGSDET